MLDIFFWKNRKCRDEHILISPRSECKMHTPISENEGKKIAKISYQFQKLLRIYAIEYDSIFCTLPSIQFVVDFPFSFSFAVVLKWYARASFLFVLMTFVNFNQCTDNFPVENITTQMIHLKWIRWWKIFFRKKNIWGI